MVEHRSHLQHDPLAETRDLATVHANDAIILHNLNYTFDPSPGLIFPTLASGAADGPGRAGARSMTPHRLLERCSDGRGDDPGKSRPPCCG